MSQRIKYSLCFLIVAAWLNGCSEYCTSRIISMINVTGGASPSDTAVVITKYAAGSNFSSPLDSVSMPFDLTYYAMQYHGTIYYDFSDAEKDYTIKFLPSGTTHTVTNIGYGHKKNRSGCGGGSRTDCSYSYVLDGQKGGRGAEESDSNSDPGFIAL